MSLQNKMTSADSVKLPGIIYGTAWKKEHTSQLVKQALELGFRGIDTACQLKHYDEAAVGVAIQDSIKLGLSRKELYIQTKFTSVDGHDAQSIPYDIHASLAEQVQQSFQQSLKNLKTDYIDGYVLHSPLPDREQLLEVWRAMESIYFHKGAHQLGISNCYDINELVFLYKEAEIKPTVLQNRFYAKTRYDVDIRKFCQDNNIIYQSFWTLTANANLLSNSVVKKLADKYQCSEAQLFFRFLSQIGVVPLTGTRSTNHMQQDLAIFDFTVTQQDSEQISKLLSLT